MSIFQVPVWQGKLRLLLDASLLVFLLILCTNFTSFWPPTTQRGFFCNDETLMYPYHEDTVSPSMLQYIGVVMPILVVLLMEICRKQHWNIYNTLRWFLFGYAAFSLLKDMGKEVVGRLRPHFFAVCMPQLSDGGACTDQDHRQGGVYHTAYTCQPALSGATKEMLLDLHVSFPSGHTAKAFYGLVFLALYLQRLGSPLPGTLLRPVCQLFCVCLAAFVGLSRVMDYKHHWSDVAAGSLLGASVAFAVVRAAEREQRLHLASGAERHANAKPAASAAVAEADEVGPGMEQLPHDLCQVTCQSSN